jgi:hypothetical protein
MISCGIHLDQWYSVGYIWKKNSCIRGLGESVREVVSGGKLELRRGMVNICSGWSPDCGQWVISLGPPHGDVGGRNWPTYWLRDGRSRSSLTVVYPRHASSVQGRLSMMNMINLNFTWFLMMWVFSRVCSGVSSTWVWDEGVLHSVGFWRETVFLFWVGWYRGWEEKVRWPMEFELCSLHVTPSNNPKFMYFVLYYMYFTKRIRVCYYYSISIQTSTTECSWINLARSFWWNLLVCAKNSKRILYYT